MAKGRPSLPNPNRQERNRDDRNRTQRPRGATVTGPRRGKFPRPSPIPSRSPYALAAADVDRVPLEAREHPSTREKLAELTALPTPAPPVKRGPKAAAKSRQHPPPTINRDKFVQLPIEALFDRTLTLADLKVFLWFCHQTAIWRGERVALRLKDCAREIAITESHVRKSVGRLEAAGHLRVTRQTGASNTYSSPWMAIHRMARRMVADNE